MGNGFLMYEIGVPLWFLAMVVAVLAVGLVFERLNRKTEAELKKLRIEHTNLISEGYQNIAKECMSVLDKQKPIFKAMVRSLDTYNAMVERLALGGAYGEDVKARFEEKEEKVNGTSDS
jgi:hypothetical protein